MLVEAAGTRLLIDPGVFCPTSVFNLADLDAIVVTHQHPDHCDPARIASLVEANPQARLLADPDTAAERPGDRDWEATEAGVEASIGALTLTGVGRLHAEILPTLPRISNVGVLITGLGEPTFFHPGDSYEHAPEGVEVLALPLAAPWAKISETVDFARRVAPTTMFPIHDSTIAEIAYGIYWGHVSTHAEIADPRRLGPAESMVLTA